MAAGGGTSGSSTGFGPSLYLMSVGAASTRVRRESSPMYVRIPGHSWSGGAASGMVARLTGQGTGQAASGSVPATAPAIAAGITTLMVRNLPRRVTLKNLVEEMEANGFLGVYDLVYLPAFPGSGANKGFAFVNFTSHMMAKTFAREWDRSQRFGMARRSRISIAVAATQGYDATLAIIGIDEQSTDPRDIDENKLLLLRAAPTSATAASGSQASAVAVMSGPPPPAPSELALPMPRFLGGAFASSSFDPLA